MVELLWITECEVVKAAVVSDACHSALATFGLDIKPAFIASNSPVFQRRASTPERFVHFIQAIGVANAQVRELMFIHLAK